MSLDRVVDLLADRLAAAMGPGTRVDDVAPVGPADLPCVVLSLDTVRTTLVGVGRVPRGTRTGALQLTAVIDLANPVLDLGDGEQLTLLSADRLTVTLPNGPLVGADGTEGGPIGPDDLSADDGTPFTVVTSSPTGRGVRADAAEGTLRFGSALAADRTLTVTYHVGRWDVVTSRAQGALALDVTAVEVAAVRGTSRALAEALAVGPSHGGVSLRLSPLAWGAVTPGRLDDDTTVRSQRLLFDLDAEVEDPVLTTGGGVITRVAVTGAFTPTRSGQAPEPFEPFDVTRGVPT
ncbi:hypothetical protein [Jannaschia sp. R86511]|uniref:hypothetical protein n=1 Tax=Jannaschia sp. R86511 TaxID=3093853 RepID=UPI0036D43219